MDDAELPRSRFPYDTSFVFKVFLPDGVLHYR